MKTFCSDDGFCAYRDYFGNCMLPCPFPQEIKTDKQDIPFQQAFDVVVKELRENRGLYIKLQTNIEVAFFNAVRSASSAVIRAPQLHDIGNIAAKNFLDSLIKREGK